MINDKEMFNKNGQQPEKILAYQGVLLAIIESIFSSLMFFLYVVLFELGILSYDDFHERDTTFLVIFWLLVVLGIILILFGYPVYLVLCREIKKAGVAIIYEFITLTVLALLWVIISASCV